MNILAFMGNLDNKPPYDDNNLTVYKVRKMALNDNQIIDLLVGFGEDGQLRNPLDMVDLSNLPQEVSVLLGAITKERPTFPGFENPEDAYDFIRDRYAQFGGELDEFAQYLSEQFPKEQPKPEEPAQSAASEPASLNNGLG